MAREPTATEIFIVRSHRAVYALAYRICPDPALRMDWTHEVLLRLLEEMATGTFVYQGPGCFWAWFRKRAYYLMLNQLTRRLRIVERESCESFLSRRLDSMVSTAASSPAEEFARAELRRRVRGCLAQIQNEEQRRALHLRLDHQLSYGEIAVSMGATLNTVRSWIRRGRVALRRNLAVSLGLAAQEETGR